MDTPAVRQWQQELSFLLLVLCSGISQGGPTCRAKKESTTARLCPRLQHRRGAPEGLRAVVSFGTSGYGV